MNSARSLKKAKKSAAKITCGRNVAGVDDSSEREEKPLASHYVLEILRECSAGRRGETPWVTAAQAFDLIWSWDALPSREQGALCARCGRHCAGALRMMGCSGPVCWSCFQQGPPQPDARRRRRAAKGIAPKDLIEDSGQLSLDEWQVEAKW